MTIICPALWISVACGLLGAAALQIFFSGFKETWPSSYSPVTSELDAHHRRGAVNFIFVRLAPVVLLSGMAATFAISLAGTAYKAAITTGLAHVTINEFRAMWNRRKNAPPALVAYYSVSALAVITGAALGGYLGSTAKWLFPSAPEMRDALWTAAAATVLAAWYLKKTSTQIDESSRLDLIRQDVGEELWQYIPTIANENNADPYLIQALVAAEVTQRPRWIRRLERRLPWGASYGVAQISGHGNITDIESVVLLSKTFAGVVPHRSRYGGLLFTHRLENDLENHNSNPAFISDVLTFLELLPPQAQEQSEDVAPDGFPYLIVYSAKRVGGVIQLTGSWYGDTSTLIVSGPVSPRDRVTLDAGEWIFGEDLPESMHNAAVRRKWKASMPIDLDSATIEGRVEGSVQKVDVDFSYAMR